ncbi:MAG: HisA/HisF-related TIM barrel protein [Pirellulaceae bacterium]
MSNQPADFSSVVHCFVGVIDLKAGQAVHAVAGDRQAYQGVKLSSGRSCSDPIELAKHYSALGLRQLYIADLDGIETGEAQTMLLSRLLRDGPTWDTVLLDLGWTGSTQKNVVRQLAEVHSCLHFIAATEAAESPESLKSLSQFVGSQRTILGMDYRNGAFVSRTTHTQGDWFSAATDSGVDTFVVLDVATVGTGNAIGSLDCCRRAKETVPESHIYSGGGIASVKDVDALIAAGCDNCLVATCLL